MLDLYLSQSGKAGKGSVCIRSDLRRRPRLLHNILNLASNWEEEEDRRGGEEKNGGGENGGGCGLGVVEKARKKERKIYD